MLLSKAIHRARHLCTKWQLYLCRNDLKREKLQLQYVRIVRDWYNHFGPAILKGNILDSVQAQLADRMQYLPRSLSTMDDQESIDAPVRGIGSPNGVVLTNYKDASTKHPRRIVYAGSTGDAVLNRKLFTSLYATALASDLEPTLVTTNGGIINWSGEPGNNEGAPHKLLSAVLGPEGFAEPHKGVASLGMTIEESMKLIADFFSETSETTGLTQVHEWDYSNASQFEKKLREVFSKTGKDGDQALQSPETHSENIGVIEAIPFLLKAKDGSISPATITLPKLHLEITELHNLMSDIRKEHMNSLIQAGERRMQFALAALREQEEAMTYWQSLSNEEKREVCLRQPHVLIQYSYDFVLGIIRRLPTPEKVAKQIYEEQHRPGIKKASEESYRWFRALCQKLATINAPGGKADVLSLKFLIDSLIRRAPLQFEDAAIQNNYNRLIKHTSLVVWNSLRHWAIDNKVDLGLLASDNVIFNTTVRDNNLEITPYILVDINNYVAHINSNETFVRWSPGSKMSTLRSTIVMDPQNGISDPASLYSKFSSWLGATLSQNPDFEIEAQAASNKLREQPSVLVYNYCMLQIARSLVLHGRAKEALQTLAKIRASDYASVYFWGAAAALYTYLDDLSLFRLLSGTGTALNVQQKVNVALNLLIAKLRFRAVNPQELRSRIAGGNMDGANELADWQQAAVSATIPEGATATQYIDQLFLKCKGEGSAPNYFLVRLLAKENIQRLENEEFGLSDEQLRTAVSVMAGLSAVELLRFARKIVSQAQALKPENTGTEIRTHTLGPIVHALDCLMLGKPDCSSEIEKIQDCLETPESFEKLQDWLETPSARRLATLDTWGTYAIKSRLHAVAELVADEALNKALRAADTLKSDVYGVVIPSIVLLCWKRGYASALNLILKTEERTGKVLGEYSIRDVSSDCPVSNGVVTAEDGPEGTLKILLDGHVVGIVEGVSGRERDLIAESVNNNGRLGMAKAAHASIIDRMKEIRIMKLGQEDNLVNSFYKNREALIAIVSRRGLPGLEGASESRTSEVQGQPLFAVPKTKFRTVNDLLESTKDESSQGRSPQARSYHSYHATKPYIVEDRKASDSKVNLEELEALRSAFGDSDNVDVLSLSDEVRRVITKISGSRKPD